MGVVYAIRGPDEKLYIGSSKLTAEARWARHVISSRDERRKSRFYQAVRLHGPERFTVETLYETDDVGERLEREAQEIREKKTCELGYNTIQPLRTRKQWRADNPTLVRDQKRRYRARLTQLGAAAAAAAN